MDKLTAETNSPNSDASGLIFRHAKNTKMPLGQSVDGIYFARLSGAHSARIDGRDTTQLAPRTPELNVGPGNIYSSREGPHR